MDQLSDGGFLAIVCMVKDCGFVGGALMRREIRTDADGVVPEDIG